MSNVGSRSDDQSESAAVEGSIEKRIDARRADLAFRDRLDALFEDEHEVFERLAHQ